MVFRRVKLIDLEGEEKEIEVKEGSCIFEFVENVGMELLYFCRLGICGMCCGKIVFGKVD